MNEQNALIAELKTVINKKQEEIRGSRMKEGIFKDKTEKLTTLHEDLERRLASEREVFMRAKKDAKETEQENIMAKLSYQTQKEQSDLIRRENDMLVSLLLRNRSKNSKRKGKAAWQLRKGMKDLLKNIRRK